jgi:hypothetical protein
VHSTHPLSFFLVFQILILFEKSKQNLFNLPK